MQLSTLGALFLFGLNAVAQDCPKYAKAMAAGNGFLYKASPDYDSALLYFQVALVAARECRTNNDSATKQLKKVFEGIKAQRDEAVKAKQEAQTASLKTKAALTKAEKLINAFYFYDDRFALSVKQVESSRKYGFINKNGDVVIPYNYEYAEQFDYSGFAKVKKKDHYGESGGGIFDYLVDTGGKDYLVSYEFPDIIKALNPYPADTFQLRFGWLTPPKYHLFADALDFRNKNLLELPVSLPQFDNFKILLLGGNKLVRLPRSVGDYKLLTVLDLSGNNLEELPINVGNLENLKTLLVSGNQLRQLPSQIGNLKKLETLNLDANALDSLPSSIGHLTALKKLVLRRNYMKNLPMEIVRLQQLRILDVAYLRGLDTFPRQITQLVNLEVLNVSGNHFKTFPGFEKLAKLHTLDISFMGLNTLPPEIVQLKQLRKLHVYGNWDMNDAERRRIQKLLPRCEIINAPLHDLMEILND